MTSSKFDFGNFMWNTPNINGVVTVTITDGGTPKKQVIKAIRFAKMMRCSISRRVEYHPNDYGGTVDFEVTCNRFTDQQVYPYGTAYTSYKNSQIDIKDIATYKRKFRTDRMVQPGFRKKFWYRDGWTGETKYFPTLKKATEAAKKEVGNLVSIYTNFPYGELSRLKCEVPGSGHTPS